VSADHLLFLLLTSIHELILNEDIHNVLAVLWLLIWLLRWLNHRHRHLHLLVRWQNILSLNLRHHLLVGVLTKLISHHRRLLLTLHMTLVVERLLLEVVLPIRSSILILALVYPTSVVIVCGRILIILVMRPRLRIHSHTSTFIRVL
jgi:hypothetical protein